MAKKTCISETTSFLYLNQMLFSFSMLLRFWHQFSYQVEFDGKVAFIKVTKDLVAKGLMRVGNNTSKRWGLDNCRKRR